MSKAKLNKTQTKQVIRDVLAGQSWQEAAYQFDFGYLTLRNIIADNLRLHVPTRRVKRKIRKRRTSGDW